MGPLDMDEEAEQPESDQEALGKPHVWCHDKAPSHRDERRPLYRSHLRPHEPFVAGTPPDPCGDDESNSPNEHPVGARSPQAICPVLNVWPRARGAPSPFT